MLVALAVSAIIIGATYASYEMVATQYHKNMDIANMHTSGRAIMRIIERDVRMAGFEYRDKDAKITYGSISNPLTIKDSGNKCCDEVTVIYDYFDEESKKAERIRIRYWAESHTSNKGSRHRLYKQKDILGRNKKILAKPKLGTKDVMADYIEDLQIVNVVTSSNLYSGSDYRDNIEILDISERSRRQPEGWIIGTDQAGCLASGKDGLLYAGSTDNGEGITIYNPSKNKKGRIGYINTGLRATSDIVIDEQGLIYQSTTQEKTIAVYDPVTKKQIKLIQTNFTRPRALAIDSGNLLYVGGDSVDEVRIFNTSTGIQTGTIKLKNQGGGRIFPWKMTVSDGLLYVSARNQYMISIYYINSGRYAGYIPTNPIRSDIAISPNGNLYAGRWQQRGIDIYNKITAQKIGYIPTKNRVYALTFINENTGSESLVTINLILRTKNQYGKDRQFKKKDYHGGNFKIDKTDKYKRDTFSSTVLVRNLAL
jgi:sugar lactone lactonase YvrE